MKKKKQKKIVFFFKSMDGQGTFKINHGENETINVSQCNTFGLAHDVQNQIVHEILTMR